MTDGINPSFQFPNFNKAWLMLVERPPARSFRDLLVWQKAHQYVLLVYSFTARFPKTETYGLSLQMRKAAVSIPANIAEGFRRRGKADKVRFLNTSESSLEESRYYLILSQDLDYGQQTSLWIPWRRSVGCSMHTQRRF